MLMVIPPAPLPVVVIPIPSNIEAVPPPEMVELLPLEPAKVNKVPPVVKQETVVQSVPVVGSVISVAAVVLRIKELAPIVWNASANWTVLPAAMVNMPLPVEMILPLIVAVDNREVEMLLAARPKVDIPPKAVT